MIDVLPTAGAFEFYMSVVQRRERVIADKAERFAKQHSGRLTQSLARYA
jgi:hypothetical protein